MTGRSANTVFQVQIAQVVATGVELKARPECPDALVASMGQLVDSCQIQVRFGVLRVEGRLHARTDARLR